MTRRTVHTSRAPKAIGPYSQGIVHGGLVFCAGQIPLDPDSGHMVEGDIGAQTRRVLQNLRAVLEEGGSSLDSILRLEVYLTDLSLFSQVNEVLSGVFTREPPARVTVEVSGLPLGARIEMAAIAAVEGQGLE